MIQITSRKNPVLKYCEQLRNKSAFRKKEGRFLVEGFKEIQILLASGYKPFKILCSLADLETSELNELQQTGAEILDLSSGLLESICVRKNKGNIVAIAEKRRAHS